MSDTLMFCSNHRFKFEKRRQPFIRTHNEPLTVAAMRVSNEDCSPVGVHARDVAPTPTGFAQIVSDALPILHERPSFKASYKYRQSISNTARHHDASTPLYRSRDFPSRHCK